MILPGNHDSLHAADGRRKGREPAACSIGQQTARAHTTANEHYCQLTRINCRRNAWHVSAAEAVAIFDDTPLAKNRLLSFVAHSLLQSWSIFYVKIIKLTMQRYLIQHKIVRDGTSYARFGGTDAAVTKSSAYWLLNILIVLFHAGHLPHGPRLCILEIMHQHCLIFFGSNISTACLCRGSAQHQRCMMCWSC